MAYGDEKRTLLIYGYIGEDVSGNYTAQNIFSMVQYGCTDLEVRINSMGGKMSEAYSIYAALAAFPGNTCAYVDGMAFSAAGWLVQACKVRKIASNALMMMHNPSVVQPGSITDEQLEYYRNSIISMFTSRTGKTAEEIGALMDSETWFTAEQALAAGLVDEIYDPIAEIMETGADEAKEAEEMYNRFAEALNAYAGNKFNQSTNTMKEVVNALGLPEKAAMSEVVNSITDLKSKLVDAENKVQALTDSKTVAETELASVKTELVAMREAEVLNLVQSAVADGRIKNEEASIKALVEIGNSSMATLKTVIDALPVNKSNPNPLSGGNGDGGNTKGMSATANAVNRINKKNN